MKAHAENSEEILLQAFVHASSGIQLGSDRRASHREVERTFLARHQAFGKVHTASDVPCNCLLGCRLDQRQRGMQ